MTLEKSLEAINENSTIVEVYGLGYVGFPLAVRLASGDISVVGIDVNQERIERLEKNELMDSEIHLEAEFVECRKNKKFVLQTQPEKLSTQKIGIRPGEKLTEYLLTSFEMQHALETKNFFIIPKMFEKINTKINPIYNELFIFYYFTRIIHLF